ncbi:multiple inositol polyphosphate phosphatase 1-like [Anabrus simplex]|uniref:multiple inositol polyphosphate phosphatase 1-like n=1 Tax=Anabrus simplex TaxID=316456 RepID=UPI0035A3A0BC
MKEGCQFEKIWMMVRHGTRNPNSKIIHKMRERLPQLRDLILENSPQGGEIGLCEEDMKALRSWTNELEDMDEKMLTASGEEEMIELAERFQARFPDLFPESYSNSTFLFRYTATQRTSASARAFTVGLFGRKMSYRVWYPPAVKRDPVLRFYKLCKRWKEQVRDNPEALSEQKKFEAGSEMQRTLINVSGRLNLNFTLSLEDVRLMYLTCAFETAWYRWKKSPWCAAFSEENFKVLEFAEDLNSYWVDGYGYNLTYEQACPAVTDMATHIIPVLSKQDTPRTVVYFTHSGTLLKILSRLGLYKDTDMLKHSLYQSLHSRLWRVSKIDTFGTNLAFILYKCDDGYHVLTMHQEEIVRIPGCEEHQELCPLDLFSKSIQDYIDGCNFELLCYS